MNNGSAMKYLAWFVRAAIVAAFVLAIIIKPDGRQTSTDTAVIRNYDAVMDLDKAGNLSLNEDLLVVMPAGKHGIYRIFDTADPRRSNVEHPVTVQSIERDGSPEPSTFVDSARGTMSVRIGDANVILEPGNHQYTIRSSTTDVFEPGSNAWAEAGDAAKTTLWWWDVVGQGWQMPIEAAHITVNLPTEPTAVECIRATNIPCTARVEGTRMFIDAEGLDPFEAVTVRAAFPADQLDPPIPGPSNVVPIVIGVVLGLLVAAFAVFMVSRTREKPVGLPVLFEPPQGIYPALGVKVLNEIESPYAFQATLFDLAERGLLHLAGNDSGWDITVVGDPSATLLTAAEAGVLAKLGLTAQGSRFELRKTVASGEKISEAQKNLNSQVTADAKPYLDTSPIGCGGSVLGWLSIIGFGVMVVRSIGGNEIIWPLFIPVAVAAFCFAGLLFDRAAWTTRNAAGRDMWSRVGGFARFLTTDSAEDRFDFAKRQDLYPRYLPWALVLGSADAWAQRYRDHGVEPPVVPWLLWTGSSSTYSMTSMTSSFNSAISSAASAYSASQSSSGGGFSGGSGGGGGGGGSW